MCFLILRARNAPKITQEDALLFPSWRLHVNPIPRASYRSPNFASEDAIANLSPFGDVGSSDSMETVESAHRPDDRAPFFRTFVLRFPRRGERDNRKRDTESRSSPNVFVMPVDAYLSYIRFHHGENALRVSRNKAPAERSDQRHVERSETPRRGERRRQRQREANSGGKRR
jgi:hypothetical protein